MTVPVDPIAVALAVTRALDALGIVHTIGGSIASSIAGEPRSTLDIDIVAALGDSDVAALVTLLSPDFYVNEEALRRAVRDRSSTNLIHQATQVKVDIFVAGGTPLDEQQHWYRKGGEASDRQWRDVLGIVRVQGQQVDRAYLDAKAPVLGVAALLARALQEGTGD